MSNNFISDEYAADGWRITIDSGRNYYERLLLRFEDNPSTSEINQKYLSLYQWWTQADKLKGSNPKYKDIGPHAQKTLKELGEIKTLLSDSGKRRDYDNVLRGKLAEANESELLTHIKFCLKDRILSPDEQRDLFDEADKFGISRARAKELIESEMRRIGARYGEGSSAGPGSDSSERTDERRSYDSGSSGQSSPQPQPTQKSGGSGSGCGSLIFLAIIIIAAWKSCFSGNDNKPAPPPPSAQQQQVKPEAPKASVSPAGSKNATLKISLPNIKNAVERFDNVYTEGGMSGLRFYIDDCYAKIIDGQSADILHGVEYCYSIDAISGGVDKTTTEQLKMPRTIYFTDDNRMKRLWSVFDKYNSNGQLFSNADQLTDWLIEIGKNVHSEFNNYVKKISDQQNNITSGPKDPENTENTEKPVKNDTELNPSPSNNKFGISIPTIIVEEDKQ